VLPRSASRKEKKTSQLRRADCCAQPIPVREKHAISVQTDTIQHLDVDVQALPEKGDSSEAPHFIVQVAAQPMRQTQKPCANLRFGFTAFAR
jgi:hypothetical protein